MQRRADRRRARELLLALALAAVVSVAIVAGTISRDSDASPTPDPAMLSVSQTPYGRPMAPGFVGLSLEYWTLRAYTGSNPQAINPVLVQLIRNLAPAPVIRFGGDSTDWTWAPTSAVPRPPGIRFTLTKPWLRSARALAAATNARMILGINLEAGSRPLAAAEARALIGGIGRSRIAALEIGNEPELYGSFGWYRTASGQEIPGRPHGYDPPIFARDFARFGAALPRLPLAGPAIGGQQWIHYTPAFVAAEPRLRMVTLHRYPLQWCFLPAASHLYPTLAHLLSPPSTHGLAEGVAAYAAAAHRHGLPLRIDELGSVSCGGARGISDRFASALWSLDTLFELARVGVDGVNFHTFRHAVYAPFAFTHSARTWRASVKPEYYAMLMFNQAYPAGARLLHIDGHTPPATHAWATRSRTGAVRVLLINDGLRRRTVTVSAAATPTSATLERLTAPGLRAKHHIALGGQSFGTTTRTGLLAGERNTSEISAHEGVYAIRLPPTSAALLTLQKR